MSEKAIEVMSDQYVKVMRLLAENRRLQTELNTAIQEVKELKIERDTARFQRNTLHAELTAYGLKNDFLARLGELVQRAERAEAILAEVRALSVRWDEDGVHGIVLRAVLDAPPKGQS